MGFFHTLAVILVRHLPAWVVSLAIYILKPKVVVGVVSVVPKGDGTYLFLHHTYRKQYAWRLPGGLAERHEEPFQTAVRELYEEANIIAKAVCVLDVRRSTYSTLDVAVLCTVESSLPFTKNIEVDDLLWVDPHQAPFAITKDQMAFLHAATLWLSRDK